MFTREGRPCQGESLRTLHWLARAFSCLLVHLTGALHGHGSWSWKRHSFASQRGDLSVLARPLPFSMLSVSSVVHWRPATSHGSGVKGSLPLSVFAKL